MISVNELDFEKGGGLIPVVVQDYSTREVLMVAYVNKEALEKTIESGYAHYWSRSRKSLWKKG
ncbi:MAG: phosphoribosyl-AMP cyclohydrolase, partial [Nitrososphaerales archaeon]